MNAQIFTELLYSIGFISLFLLLGVFLRAKIKFFGQTFIPASVIGGFILFILGANGFNLLNIPTEWIEIYSLIPGILIVPIVAAVPLGLRLTSGVKAGKNVLSLAAIMIAVALLQFALGFGTQFVFSSSYTFYDTFGWELGIGYVGGHGTAGLLGNMLHQANLPYWQDAQGVAITTATFGLVGGILFGMLLINFASRRGHTQILKNVSEIPQAYKIGYIKEPEKQASMGRETTLSASIDALAFHLALILGVCAVAYFVLNLIKAYEIPILNKIAIWAYAVIIMFIVWNVMLKLKLDFLVDDKIKSRIAGTLTEYAVIAAIAALPLKTIFIYLLPILTMVVLGFIFTIAFLYFMCCWLLKDYWFEHMIAALGCCTGVFLTGILLLRICDPDFKTSVLANYSLAYTILSVIYFAALNFILVFILEYGVFFTLIFCIVFTCIFSLLAVLASKFRLEAKNG